MYNLFLIYETFTNGLYSDILNIISLFVIFCGIFVIISKNPVISILFLIGLFQKIDYPTRSILVLIHFKGILETIDFPLR